MPFAASERHEIWSANARHLDMADEFLVGGKAYAVTVGNNFSRAILASAVTRRQDLSSFISVLYSACPDKPATEIPAVSATFGCSPAVRYSWL